MKITKKRICQIWLILKYYVILAITKICCKKENNIWLISERGDEARDNAYVFYKYLKDKHPEICVKYVITKSSSDIQKIDEKDIVVYRSIKHITLFITAKYLISTHLQGCSPEFHSFMKLSKKGLVKVKGKQIMLQHGITKDLIPILFKQNNKDLNLIICGAKPEYDYMKRNFGYSKDEIKYTGFARFDRLEPQDKKQILLMPTWRDYLYKSDEKEFKNSDYFKRYNELINNKEILNLLEQENYKLIFYPHYEIQKYLHCFGTKSDRIVIASSTKYDIQNLLKESSLLITDYSSVYFDFAYMCKPVIYYHFDYKKYRETQYNEGYFNYEKNGFGPVVSNVDSLIKELKNAFERKFILNDEYLRRNSNFYKYHDKNNCERIYNEIIKLK